MNIEAAGLGNAIMDALIRIDDDRVLADLGLTRGQMHPVDHHRWHEVYERLKHHGVEVHSGGSCANTMATMALCGARVRYCGQVGDDAFGAMYTESMVATCGGHALVTTTDQVTGKCLSLISRKDGERTMLTDLGAAVHLAGIGDFADTIRNARLLHLTGYLFLGGPVREAAYEALKVAHAANIPVSLDVADPFVARTIRDDIERILREHVTVAFLNREEAEHVTGQGAYPAVDTLADWVEVAVVKLGGEGSLVRTGGRTHKIPVFPAQVADTTGAGDAYAGGFLYGWLRGMSPEKCGILGSRVAALTVSQVGAVCRDADAIASARDATEVP